MISLAKVKNFCKIFTPKLLVARKAWFGQVGSLFEIFSEEVS